MLVSSKIKSNTKTKLNVSYIINNKFIKKKNFIKISVQGRLDPATFCRGGHTNQCTNFLTHFDAYRNPT